MTDQLISVQQVVPADHAFAAILTDGHVVAWGDTESALADNRQICERCVLVLLRLK